MEFDDEFIFFFCEISAFKVRSKIVNPTKPTTLTAPKETCKRKKPIKNSSSHCSTKWQREKTYIAE